MYEVWADVICSNNAALFRSSVLFRAVIWRESVLERPSGSVTVSEMVCVPDISNL